MKHEQFLIKKMETALFVKRVILVGKPFLERTREVWKLLLYFLRRTIKTLAAQSEQPQWALRISHLGKGVSVLLTKPIIFKFC